MDAEGWCTHGRQGLEAADGARAGEPNQSSGCQGMTAGLSVEGDAPHSVERQD